MNTKILTLGLFLGALSMGLSSCLGEPENISSFSINVSNMIIPNDPSKPVTVDVNCTYNLRLDGVKNKITVGTSTLSFDGSNNLSFNSSEMNCINYSVASLGFTGGSFARGTANLSNGTKIEGINGLYTSMVFTYDVVGEPFMVVVSNPMLIMNYKTQDATVKTFSMNPFFKGKTTTTYNFKGEEQTFTTDEAVYRVNFASDMKKANVLIYNIRFASQMPRPLQAVVLKDLPVTLTREGYIIEAADFVPEMLESGALTPNPSYKFDSFRLITTSSDLTEASCTYTVNGSFKGSFSGSYCGTFSYE